MAEEKTEQAEVKAEQAEEKAEQAEEKAEQAEEKAEQAEEKAEQNGNGTGRRKEAVVRVRLVPGTGQVVLNGRPIEDYFPARSHRLMITSPFRVVGREKEFDVIARLDGGGVAGQAGALRHGIARALVDLDPGLRPALKKEGLLTRDPREKERRKYGLKKARKAPQFSKR